MHELARNTWIIARREFAAYFATPLASVFLTIFVAATGAFAFYIGGFFDRGQANLNSFFAYHPWLYLLLVPAVAMRLWAEERKSGTIELLMTLPISPAEAIVGKFAAAWAFIGLMAMAMMVMLAGVVGNAVTGFAILGGDAAAQGQSESLAIWFEGIRRIGVALYLVAISLGLASIIEVIRFQAIRLRELPGEPGR